MRISLVVLLATLSHVCTAEIVAETQHSVVEGQSAQEDVAEKLEGEFERVLYYGGMYGGYGGGNCCKLVCEKPRPRRRYYYRSKSMMMSRRTKESEPDEDREQGRRALHGKGYYGGYGGYGYGGGYGHGYGYGGGYGHGYGYGSLGDCRYDCSACAPPAPPGPGHYPPHMWCFPSSTESDGCDCDCRCCPDWFAGVACSCDCDCPRPRPPIYRSKAMMMGGSGGYSGSGDYDDGYYGSGDDSGGYRSTPMVSGSGSYGGGSSGGYYYDEYVEEEESPDATPADCCEPEIVCNPVDELDPVEDEYKDGYEDIEVDWRERNLQDGEIKPNGAVGEGHYPQGPGIVEDCQVVGCLIYGNPTCEPKKEEPQDHSVPYRARSGSMMSGSPSNGHGKPYPETIEHVRK